MSQQNKNEQNTFNQNEKQYSSNWKDEIPNCLAFEVASIEWRKQII